MALDFNHKIHHTKQKFNQYPIWLRWFFGAAIIYLICTLLLGLYWSREPKAFFSDQVQTDPVTGLTSALTMHKVVSTLLEKPGGFISNDITPPGIWLDNIRNWEYGVIIQTRDFARAFRKDFSRSQSQSIEDVDLTRTEPKFNFNTESWAFPASENEYREGLAHLDKYIQRLRTQTNNTYFYARADNLNNWLGDVETRLGSLSQRLSSSVGTVNLNVNQNAEDNKRDIIQTPWMQIDDVFYESRGQIWALIHFLKAVEIDFHAILTSKGALVSLRQIIRELEATQATIWSPMILNGSGLGFLANHSLTIANYISRANAGIADLRRLLQQG